MTDPSEMIADFAIDMENKQKRHALKSKEDELVLVNEYHNKVNADYEERFHKHLEQCASTDPETVAFAQNLKAFCDDHAKKAASLEYAHQSLPKEIVALKQELGVSVERTYASPVKSNGFHGFARRDEHNPHQSSSSSSSSSSDKKTSKANDLSELEKDLLCMENCVKECQETLFDDTLEQDDANMKILDNLLQELEGVQDELVEIMSSDSNQHYAKDIVKAKKLFKASQKVWQQVWELAKTMNDKIFSLLEESEKQDPFIGRTTLR